jgi:acetylornithine deacetylase/succinyl-diaminopimelate desuccinylase-like protein
LQFVGPHFGESRLLSVSHGPREFVKRRDIEDCAVVYARAAMTLLS